MDDDKWCYQCVNLHKKIRYQSFFFRMYKFHSTSSNLANLSRPDSCPFSFINDSILLYDCVKLLPTTEHFRSKLAKIDSKQHFSTSFVSYQ